MSEIRKQQIFIALLVIGIILVVLLGGITLIGVWKFQINAIKEVNKYELGTIKYKPVTEEQYVKKYFSEIEDVLNREDYDKLYDMLGEDYIEYTQMTKESLQELIGKKKITNTQLQLTAYQAVETKYFANTYILSVKQKNGIYDANITIREISPNDYTIAFDDYIASEDPEYTNTMNSLNIVITRATYFSDYVEYDVKLKNLHDNTIVLNSSNNQEGFYLKLEGEKLVAPTTMVLGGRSVSLETERTKEYTLRYLIKNENMNSIESLLISDVYYEGVDKTAIVEYSL